MSQNFELNATLRADMGKGASRRLRRLEGNVPGIIYGTGKDPVSLTFKGNEIAKAILSEAFYSSIITVNVDGKAEKAVVKDMQRHPAKDFVMHLDMLRIDENKEIQINIPLHFINEEKCVGVKIGGGKISHTMAEVEISCLPKHLPEYIEVDMLEVELEQTLHLSDIICPEGVTIVALTHGEDHDHPIAAVHTPKGGTEEEEEESAEAAEGEETAEGEEAKEEGGE
jgi:large subunit ribosomal protein L25